MFLQAAAGLRMLLLMFTYWCLRRASSFMVVITTSLSTVALLVKVFFYSFSGCVEIRAKGAKHSYCIAKCDHSVADFMHSYYSMIVSSPRA